MVTTTVTAKFHNPTRKRRQEWQQTTQLYRDTKQFLADGWENNDFMVSEITTADIDNPLYSAIQNQAIREAKGDYKDEDTVEYQSSQPFALNNQNWEIHTTDNDNVVIGFPCISGWWYTPIEVYNKIQEPTQKLLDGEAEKTRLQIYRRGSDWYCTFNIEHEAETDGGTEIGVDIGQNHLLAVTVPSQEDSMLVSGKQAKYIRRKYRSLRRKLQLASSLRERDRVGNKENLRIKDLNHKLSRQLINYAKQYRNPVIKMEDLEDIREGSNWKGVHS